MQENHQNRAKANAGENICLAKDLNWILQKFKKPGSILSSHPPPCSRIQFPHTPPATPRPRPIAGRLEGQSCLPAEAALFVDNGRENSFLS